MKRIVVLLVTVATVAGVVAVLAQTSTRTDGFASQSAAETATLSAKQVRGVTPYIEIKNEPAPKLIVDPPLPEGLALGVVWIQYRVENMRIVPVFGESSTKVSPRIGHLHLTVDDLSWWWADASDNNTIDIAGLPAGQHKVRIELVNANHQIVPGQTKTLTFNLPVQLRHE
jgi:Family of unknown function (DUF6130)